MLTSHVKDLLVAFSCQKSKYCYMCKRRFAELTINPNFIFTWHTILTADVDRRLALGLET